MPFVNKQIFFIHIPKTGGSSIERLLDIQIFKGLSRISSHYKTSLTHLPLSILENEIPNISQFTLFTVVRNPYDRLLSEFFWRFKWDQNIELHTCIQRFNRFVKIVLKELISVERIISFDRHLETQESFLTSEKHAVKWFKLEEVNILENWLSNKLHKPIQINTFNKSQKPFNFLKEDFLRNTETLQIINTFYKQDFALFNYKLLE